MPTSWRGYIRLIKDVGSREALTRRFFLIFQYEEVRRGDGDDFSQIYGMMQTAEQNTRAYFLQCGNTILPARKTQMRQRQRFYICSLTAAPAWMSRSHPV